MAYVYITPSDFGAVGNATADDTSAVTNAIASAAASGNVLDGQGKTYRLTAKVNVLSNLKLQNITFAVDHTGTGVGQATSGGGGNEVARCYFENVRVIAKQNAAVAWDCVTFQYCQWVNCFVGTSGGSKFARAWKLSNVAYWNTFYSPEVEAVSSFGWDLNDANDTRLFMPRHVDFSGTPTAAIYMSGACSGISLFGPSFEAAWSQQPIQFHGSATNNQIYGGRCELRSPGVATQAVKFNGSAQNSVRGLYAAGLTASDAVGNNQAEISSGTAIAAYMGTGQFFPSQNTANADTAGGITYNTSRQTFTGYAGGSRDFMMTPARSTLDLNGWPIDNAAGIILSAAATAAATGKVCIGNATATTVGTAGPASAPPTNPLGYLIAYVGSDQVKIPYFRA